jgi:hypothetical protein
MRRAMSSAAEKPQQQPGRRPEICLKVLLRYMGTVTMIALVAVFMPFSWMEGAHLVLGMGTLPTEPVTSYLARSLSLFYAMLGALLWFLSFNPRQYQALIRFLSVLLIIFGCTTVWIDFHVGMPWFWRYLEGPIVIFYGFLLFIFSRALKPEQFQGD